MREHPNLRWWIAGLLFLSTVLNYIDRQCLSVLARTIQTDLHMTDLDYSEVVQAFLLAYTFMFLVAGRVTDWLGTRIGMALFIAWWSVANLLTAFARSAFALGACRFLLGMGEPGNYTAAPKAVAEWFPARERGMAIGLYTAGATLGATIAPPLIAYLAVRHGWRGPFVITGALGLLWIIPWLGVYRTPPAPPAPEESETGSEWERWKMVLRQRTVWVLLLSRAITDPLWYFYLFWFPKYLTDARHLSLSELGRVAWITYLAADIGSLLGGWASGALIRRGVAVLPARISTLALSAVLVPLSPLIAIQPPLPFAIAIASVTVLAHLSWQVTLGAVILDLYPKRLVATVFGIVATGSGLGGLLSTNLVGHLVTAYSYAPVFVLMGFLHPIALALLWHLRRGRVAVTTE